jgi:dTMP kinase
VYTAYARDVVRGCRYEWVCNVYNFAVKPDLIFYFRVPIDIAVDRILSGRSNLKYYEAGMDLNLSNDIYESYKIFQTRIIDQYESMIDVEGFTVIDGTSDIEQQQAAVREKTLELIPQYQQQK